MVKCIYIPSGPSSYNPWTCHHKLSIITFWNEFKRFFKTYLFQLFFFPSHFVRSKPQTKLRTLLSVQNALEKFPCSREVHYDGTEVQQRRNQNVVGTVYHNGTTRGVLCTNKFKWYTIHASAEKHEKCMENTKCSAV